MENITKNVSLVEISAVEDREENFYRENRVLRLNRSGEPYFDLSLSTKLAMANEDFGVIVRDYHFDWINNENEISALGNTLLVTLNLSFIDEVGNIQPLINGLQVQYTQTTNDLGSETADQDVMGKARGLAMSQALSDLGYRIPDVYAKVTVDDVKEYKAEQQEKLEVMKMLQELPQGNVQSSGNDDHVLETIVIPNEPTKPTSQTTNVPVETPEPVQDKTVQEETTEQSKTKKEETEKVIVEPITNQPEKQAEIKPDEAETPESELIEVNVPESTELESDTLTNEPVNETDSELEDALNTDLAIGMINGKFKEVLETKNGVIAVKQLIAQVTNPEFDSASVSENFQPVIKAAQVLSENQSELMKRFSEFSNN